MNVPAMNRRWLGTAVRVLAFALLSVACLSARGFAQSLERQKDCDTLSAPGSYPDYGPMPSFSIEEHHRPQKEPDTLIMQINAPSIAFNEASMVRLACKLGSDYPQAEKIDALLFDDKKAARNLAPYYTDEKNYGIYLWHMRAHYHLDRGKNVEFIDRAFPEYKDGLLALQRIRVNLSRSRTK
jgi:hypothetical protein